MDVGHDATVFAEENVAAGFAGHVVAIHGLTTGRSAPVPSRLKGEVLGVLARLDFMRHPAHVVHAVICQPGATHTHELPRSQHTAVAHRVKLTRGAHRVRCSARRGHCRGRGLARVLVGRPPFKRGTTRRRGRRRQRRHPQRRQLRNRDTGFADRLDKAAAVCRPAPTRRWQISAR